MAMRILFLTDTHIRGNAPRNRLDDFVAALACKLNEVAELIKKLGVDMVVHGGDLFDSPAPALGTAREFLRIIREFQAPMFLVPGNHDMFGYNVDTLNRSIVGLAAELGLFQLIEEGKVYWFEKGGVRVQLTGQPFHYDLDRRAPELDYCVIKRECDVAIHVVHGMLVHKPLFPGAPYTLIERVTATGADITLAGHNHLGFPAVCVQGKWFANPGALVRLESHVAEIGRCPSVLLIEIDGGIELKQIPLKCAAPGDQVLDRSSIEAEQFRQARLATFLQLVKETGSFEAVDLESIVNEISRRNSVAPQVTRKALELLGAASQSMKEGIVSE
ncbi:MAG: metallophosphoesterase family protein [Bacillota bacterium]